ncbi:MAG TPA: thioredoxin domain-containing protein [Mycobacteriales bacterium]|nr:thioredoxin domain-containing protein [Mycobacteriales bacterium]
MSTRAAQQHRASRLAAEQAARQRRQRRRLWWSLSVVVGLIAASLTGYLVHRAQRPDGGSTAAATPLAVAADGAGVVIGNGPVTVELYSDFLCPACRAFEANASDEIDSLLADGRIRLVYRPVAILDRMSTNQYSTRSAAAGGCASDAGKLAGYAKVLFDNQPAEGGAGHDDEQLIRYGTAAGITDAGFEQCVRSGRYLHWVGQVTDAMQAHNVRGTPTVFVAGQQLQRPDGPGLVAAVTAAAAK